jgi:hypothetical protein
VVARKPKPHRRWGARSSVLQITARLRTALHRQPQSMADSRPLHHRDRATEPVGCA